MLVLYTWKQKSGLSKRQHILGEDGLTLCKVENSGFKLDETSATPHKSRPVCKICKGQQVYVEGKLPEKKKKQKKKEKKKKEKKKPRHKSKRDPFLHSYEWKKVRFDALKLNDGRCCLCGISADDGAVLNVDHIKPRKTHPELALTVSNLQVLCGTCNHGKGNRDETDWREPSLAKLMGEAL